MAFLHFFLLLMLIGSLMFSCSDPDKAPKGPKPALAPFDLRCEYATNPVGIDAPNPRLSWWVDAQTPRDRGLKQAAYQILIATSRDVLKQDKGDLWDSGRVESDETIQIPYQGKPLSSRSRCYWKVRCWDQNNLVSPWSEPALWEMGILKKEDWKAQWIQMPLQKKIRPAFKLEKWLWAKDQKIKDVYFRRTLDLDKTVTQVEIALSVDNQYHLFIDGDKKGGNDLWEDLEVFTLKMGEHISPGKTQIAVHAKNFDGPAGFLSSIRVSYQDKPEAYLPCDLWLISHKEEKDWTQKSFDDSKWRAAHTVCDYGKGQWAEVDQGLNPARRSLLARHEFNLPAAPVSARAYVTGLGLYELSLNGKKVGDDQFTPGWTFYPKRLQYQSYKVNWLLNEGKNVVGALLGNGWWSSGLGWNGGKARYSKPGEGLSFLLQLEIDCADGSHHTIKTGPGWKYSPSPIVENTLYHGETYNAILEQPDWDKPQFDDSKWKEAPLGKGPEGVVLSAQTSPPIRVTGQLMPKKVSELKPGVHIIDFGQNHSGCCRLTVKAPKGTRLILRHGETLNQDGTLYTENLRTARATDVYVCKGSDQEEIWSPRFTYHGYRYVELTGLPYKPKDHTIVSLVMHNAAPFAGRFSSSSQVLNSIWRNVVWGQRSNLFSVPTDCPQRDERLGWMGDAQVFAPTSCWNMQMARFYSKWLKDILDSQHGDGAVTNVAPMVLLNQPAAPGWGDAVVVIPWVVYLFYNDVKILEDNYEGMKRWVDYMTGKSKGNLYETKGFGDWVAVQKSPSEPIGSAYYYYSSKLLSRIAHVLGKIEDAKTYETLADAIASAFHKKHFNPKTSQYGKGAQTENLLPLCFGITPKELQNTVARAVYNDVKARGFQLSTGFLGTVHLLPMLTQYGYHEIACDLALATTYPSLGYMVDKGATTIWERWNSDQEGPAMNSRNHFAFGCMTQWYFENLAGIQLDPETPGFKKFIIRPRPSKKIRSAESNYPSMYGQIECQWRLENNIFHLNLLAPPNTSAIVHMPCKDPDKIMENGQTLDKTTGVKVLGVTDSESTFLVGSGSYSFTAPYELQ